MTGLDKLPDGVSIDKSKKVIECTRSALEKLGDWCARTAQVFGLVLVVTTWADTALAQGANTKTWAKVEVTLVPTWSTPIPALDTKELWALTVESVNVPSTSASAAADKGGWQVAEIDWKKYTFAQISWLPREEKSVILKKMGEIWKLWEYQEWRNNLNEAANQEANQFAEKRWAVNQQNEWKLQVEQAKDQKATEIEMSNIDKMNQLLSRWIKLTPQDKAYLEWLSVSKRPPVDGLAKKLLTNPQNFA
jgi:hypothetical protein